MTAWFQEKRETHEACGQPISEAFDPENYGRYTATETGFCNACLALNAKTKDAAPEALWHVHLMT